MFSFFKPKAVVVRKPGLTLAQIIYAAEGKDLFAFTPPRSAEVHADKLLSATPTSATYKSKYLLVDFIAEISVSEATESEYLSACLQADIRRSNRPQKLHSERDVNLFLAEHL
jgi:hypothetical protein